MVRVLNVYGTFLKFRIPNYFLKPSSKSILLKNSYKSFHAVRAFGKLITAGESCSVYTLSLSFSGNMRTITWEPTNCDIPQPACLIHLHIARVYLAQSSYSES